MARPAFPTEQTAAGTQYVIPGTERPARRRPAPPPAFASEGDQLVIPGAEPIGTRALLERMAMRPIRPRKGQRGLAGTALFGG